MKTRNTPLILSAFILAFLTLSAMQAQAIIVICRPPVGITAGQTARVTAANTGDRAIIIIGGRFLDSNGNVLVQFERRVIEPGKMMSFDLNGDHIARGNERVQVRLVLQSDSRDILSSVEVFENATGKTTVFIGDPGL